LINRKLRFAVAGFKNGFVGRSRDERQQHERQREHERGAQ
jgi:hypothetical protein